MTANDEFDFDTWAKLAKEDPEGFEARRKQVLQQNLDTAPEHLRQRLEGLQWRVDCVRQQSAHPLGACIRISAMMWNGVLGSNGLVENLRRLADADYSGPIQPQQKASILSFSPPGPKSDVS